MSDTSGSGFGKFVPGFEFLQNLAGQAVGGVAHGLGQSIPQMPNLGNWVAPTFNVEDLEKRIEELKAVHFWLDQNSKALGATIQALEVQKMTLATLQNMNFSLGDVANALKLKAADAVSGFTGVSSAAPAPTPFAGLEIPPRTYGTPAAEEPEGHTDGQEDEEEDEEPAPPPTARSRKTKQAQSPAQPAGGVVDPMQWWGALSQQFQHIATNAMKDVARQTALDTTRQAASGLTEQAVNTATGVAGKVTRGLTDSVARNVGMVAGMGKAAARAVTGSPAPGAAPSRQPASRPLAKQAVTRKAPVRRRPAPEASAPQAATPQPLSTGDWPMPTSFFQVPGFSLGAAPAPSARQVTGAASKAAAKKPAAKKAASKKPAAKKAVTQKTAPAGRRR